jgi:hypothetical protein
VHRLIPLRTAALTLGLAAAAIATVALPQVASASSSQLAIIQDNGATDPTTSAATFAEFRALGANTARVFLSWSQVVGPVNSAAATKPAGFNAADPNAYPAANWQGYDDAVINAQKYGLKVDFIVAGGAPQWAEGQLPVPPGYAPFYAWEPNATEWGLFMQAVGTRYSGHFIPPGASAPLPRVNTWTIFNEPNFGEDLGPQAINGSKISVAPMMYRALLNSGWSALHATGHGHDTILVGGYAARGISGHATSRAPQGYPGNFGQTKPLLFIRTLYCVDKNYKHLKGTLAKQEGCPTSKSGYRRFKSQNPALFKASGVSDHPYPDNGTPVSDGKGDPNWATFPDLGHLATVLDSVTKVYGSHKHFPIYNDEYGYITHPPARSHYPSQAKAAVDINWAEYLSWKNPRVKSYMQYLVNDPPNNAGPYRGFASGLIDPSGHKKATYFAYNLPVYMPTTSFSHKKKIEVWGDARPAPFERSHGAQTVLIELQKGGHGAFNIVKKVKITKSGGYFDLKMKFKSSGIVRLAYTYPASDPLLPAGVAGSTIESRSFKIRVH